MNKFSFVLLTSLTAFSLGTSFASNSSCETYSQQAKSAFINSLNKANAAKIHGQLNNCLKANYCSEAGNPDVCQQKLHIYRYYAAAANTASQQQPRQLANFGSNAAQAPQQPHSKSSYDFTFKSPISAPTSSGAASANTNSESQQNSIYKDINF